VPFVSPVTVIGLAAADALRVTPLATQLAVY
jgi:hypothetical protein